MADKTYSLESAYLKIVGDPHCHSGSLKNSMSAVAGYCLEAMDACRVSIWLLSRDGLTIRCSTLCVRNEGVVPLDSTLSIEDFPIYFNSLKQSRVIAANDVCKHESFSELKEPYSIPLNIKSMLDASIRHEGEVHGVICVETITHSRDWSEPEQNFVASISDFIAQRLMADQLVNSEIRYKTFFESTNEGIAIFSDGKFVDFNSAFCTLFRCQREDMLGLTPVDISPEYQACGELSSTKAMRYIEASMLGEPQRFEWRHSRLDGTECDFIITLNYVRLEETDTLFALFRDITEHKRIEREVQLSQQQLSYRAAHDSLTGLLNREQLHLNVNHLIQLSAQSNQQVKVALVLLDLNRFKEVNDTLGHTMGDSVLVQVSQILSKAVEDNNGKLFRFGGDEFVATFKSSSCPLAFDELDHVFHQALKTSINIADINVEMSASVGIALYPDHGADSHELLRCADVAMYHCKRNESASSYYDVKNDENNKRRLSMMVELGAAIREDQLMLHFQPRINLQTNEITGCEALVRWQHPKLGLIPPDEFIPLAEMTELIHTLTAWVLKKATDQIKLLQSLDLEIPIAINISGRNLNNQKLLWFIKEVIDSGKISANLLEIEVTESALIDHPEQAFKNLDALDKLGVGIALDDFGTGYSSLSYLKELPFDTLKIDQSFIQNMMSDESDEVIVDSVINLAHNFSYKVVAEGVEDGETLRLLINKQCDEAQGYFIARPMPIDQLIEWLKCNKVIPHWVG
ncbi:MAG: EAL domain-containing protein [Marinomonas sp.]